MAQFNMANHITTIGFLACFQFSHAPLSLFSYEEKAKMLCNIHKNEIASI